MKNKVITTEIDDMQVEDRVEVEPGLFGEIVSIKDDVISVQVEAHGAICTWDYDRSRFSPAKLFVIDQ